MHEFEGITKNTILEIVRRHIERLLRPLIILRNLFVEADSLRKLLAVRSNSDRYEYDGPLGRPEPPWLHGKFYFIASTFKLVAFIAKNPI